MMISMLIPFIITNIYKWSQAILFLNKMLQKADRGVDRGIRKRSLIIQNGDQISFTSIRM